MRFRLRAPQFAIPNGVELRSADEREGREILAAHGVPAGARLIGTVGRLEPGKGLDLFLETVRLLADRPDLHFIVVGEGRERARLQARAESLGLGPRVTFTGHLADPLPVMACQRAQVHPSLRDGLPNALMEAMSIGVPCVASDAGGNRELISDGVEGFVIGSRDPALYAARVSALLDDPPLAARMSSAAIERMRRDFSVQAMVRAYEDVFERVLRGEFRRARRPA
jgi:glycosyltransferase involved in cell wall biosynthesis